MEKQEQPVEFASRLINHGCTVIVTAFDTGNNRPTGMTAQWVMPLTKTSVCVKFGNLSHTGKLAVQNKKFVVNVPTKRILSDVCHPAVTRRSLPSERRTGTRRTSSPRRRCTRRRAKRRGSGRW